MVTREIERRAEHLIRTRSIAARGSIRMRILYNRVPGLVKQSVRYINHPDMHPIFSQSPETSHTSRSLRSYHISLPHLVLCDNGRRVLH
jgi:hypothetical protein